MSEAKTLIHCTITCVIPREKNPSKGMIKKKIVKITTVSKEERKTFTGDMAVILAIEVLQRRRRTTTICTNLYGKKDIYKASAT